MERELIKGKRWTEKEIVFLKEWYGRISADEIAKGLNRPVSSIRSKAYGLRLVAQKNWTRKEERRMVKMAESGMAVKDIARTLGRKKTAVYQRFKKLNVKLWEMPKRQKFEYAKVEANPWTQEQDDLVRNLWGKQPSTWISERTGRTSPAVRNRAKKLGLPNITKEQLSKLTRLSTKRKKIIGADKSFELAEYFNLNPMEIDSVEDVYDVVGRTKEEVSLFLWSHVHKNKCPKCGYGDLGKHRKVKNQRQWVRRCRNCKRAVSSTLGTPFFRSQHSIKKVVSIIYYLLSFPNSSLNHINGMMNGTRELYKRIRKFVEFDYGGKP